MRGHNMFFVGDGSSEGSCFLRKKKLYVIIMKYSLIWSSGFFYKMQL